jgi:AcrR family transcriptional regulator
MTVSKKAKRPSAGTTSGEKSGTVDKLTPVGSRRRAVAFENKRMEILRRAALAFADNGYHQTSIDSLATRLGVSKPVLYYYAKNKDDLLFQCGEVARDALRKAMESTHRVKISGIGKIRRFFSAYAEIMCGDFGRCLALVDSRALNPQTRKKDVITRRALEQAVREMIIAGQDDGSINVCDPVLVTRALFGAFNGIPRWFRASGVLNASDITQSYLDLFITGLGRR